MAKLTKTLDGADYWCLKAQMMELNLIQATFQQRMDQASAPAVAKMTTLRARYQLPDQPLDFNDGDLTVSVEVPDPPPVAQGSAPIDDVAFTPEPAPAKNVLDFPVEREYNGN